MTETSTTDQPAEYCGHETMLPVSQVSTECVLRPGHSGSHANHEGARWRLATARDACLDNPQLTAAIGLPVNCPHCATPVPPTHWTKHLQRHHPEARPQQPDGGYCPHCGRGDAGPTADQYEELRRRARQDAVASRESERILQQQIDAQATELDRVRVEYRKAISALTKVTAQAMADPPLEQFMGGEPTEYAQGWAAAMSRIDAALDQPKETPDA